MASFAPASCSFWTMAQAMLRLLATPKTTATRSFRFSMKFSYLRKSKKQFPSLLRAALGPKDEKYAKALVRISAAEVYQGHVLYRLVEEARSHVLKFFNGVSGKESARAISCCLFSVDGCCDLFSRHAGRVNHLKLRHHAFYLCPKQRVVGTSQHQRVGRHLRLTGLFP